MQEINHTYGKILERAGILIPPTIPEPGMETIDVERKQEADATRVFFGLSIPAYYALIRDISFLPGDMARQSVLDILGRGDNIVDISDVRRKQARDFIELVRATSERQRGIGPLEVASIGILGLANGAYPRLKVSALGLLHQNEFTAEMIRNHPERFQHKHPVVEMIRYSPLLQHTFRYSEDHIAVESIE